LRPEDEKRAAIFCQNYGARLERSIFLAQSLGCRPRFPVIRIIFSGDRVIGLAKLFWYSTQATTTRARYSPRCKISAKS